MVSVLLGKDDGKWKTLPCAVSHAAVGLLCGQGFIWIYNTYDHHELCLK